MVLIALKINFLSITDVLSMKFTYLTLVNKIINFHIDYENFTQQFLNTIKQLFFKSEHQKILDYISLNIPKFFTKYPGYEIILFKLILFEMIKENKPKNDIMVFYSNQLMTLINKYNNPFSNDISLFNYLIENPDIFKSKIYEMSLEDCYRAFEKGLKICLMIFFGLEKINYNIYINEKVLFLYDINLLTNFEGHIINKYQNIQNEKLNSIQLINPQNYLFYDFFSDIGDNDLNNNLFFPYNKFQSLEPFNNKNDNNNFFNANLFFTTKENDNNKNYIKLENKKRNRTSKLSTSSKTSLNKSSSFSVKKTKIKEYQFRVCKRENIDKKILRKFSKFLKLQNKLKINSNIMDYVKNSEFFQDFIKYNLMPPFEYKEENVKFKSFNTKYLLWFFGHKFSQELYNIFMESNYDEILELITKTCKFNENLDELNLLKSYLYKIPQIFGPVEEESHDSNEINFEENDSSGNNMNNSYFSNKIINLEESEDEEKNKDDKTIIDYNLINDPENNINENGDDYFLGQLQITNNNFFINKNDNNFENNDDLDENNNNTLFQQDLVHLTCHKNMI